MPAATSFRFGPYRLDLINESLWRGPQPVPLRPKPFAILRYLVNQASRVVTKAELRQAIWPNIIVSEGVLKGYIHDLRVALGDHVETPQFIATVARRGYRFIGVVIETPAEAPHEERREERGSADESPRMLKTQTVGPSLMVGRATELEQLQSWLEQALAGRKQVVLVTGEVGIGKTTVVETFVERTVLPLGCRLGHGQCIEHYGTGEAYLPLLTALGQLCRGPDQQYIRAFLGQHAPSWLLQLPALLSTTELEALQRRAAGATQERMLRQLAEALEVLTAEHPLVLVLEDLHWSDTATMDWLAFVTRRREPARLLVIGTYRPVEVILRDHPLKRVQQELRLHGQCQELALELLPETAVAEYLRRRFPAHRVPASVAQLLYHRTDGNPLFLVTLVEELSAQGLLIATGTELILQHAEQVAREVPENLRQMIEQQLEHLSPEEQRVLEAASVVGMEFSVAAVAVGIEAVVEEVEERCTGLARRGQFLRAHGLEEWPDRTVAARYGFLHALYQEVIYERVPAGRGAYLHQRIGGRLEAAYRDRVREIAADLAVHFERGRDARRAVLYLAQAAQNAAQRCAYREAISYLTRGLELLKTLPDAPERAQTELRLQLSLGAPLMATKGWAAAELGAAYARARVLCQQTNEIQQLFPVLYGLWVFHYTRAELQAAQELGEQLLALAESSHNAALLMQAHHVVGNTLHRLGELTAAQAHLEQSLILYDPQQHNDRALLYGLDDGVAGLGYVALVLWALGYPDQALQKTRRMLTLARELAHPVSLAWAFNSAAWHHHLRREGQLTQAQAEAGMALCTTYGFTQLSAVGTILRGWALAVQEKRDEGIAEMRQGLSTCRGMGVEITRPRYLTMLAEAYGRIGQPAAGLALLGEVFTVMRHTGERFYEAESHRLKGELSLQSRHVKASQDKSAVTNPQAEACFLKAIEIARRQQAKSLELRAVTSLSRLWEQQGKQKEAREMLAEIYGWFTEGFDTKDVQEAKALLAELS